MKLPRGLARFNKVVTNRIQGIWAPRLAPWAVIVHRGRRSGREYRTPVVAFRRDDTLIVAVLYGEESDWVRNLLAAEGGKVIRVRKTFELRAPRVVGSASAPEVARLSPPARRYCRAAGKVLVAELSTP